MRLQLRILSLCGCLLLLLFTGYLPLQANDVPHSDPDNNIRLEQLTTHDGLSQNTVRCLLQDKKGFIWLGTLNGLNRYDGRKFIVYRPEYGNPHSISDNRIRELHEDKQGLIWIKTVEGRFHCFDPVQESFVEYQPDSSILKLKYDSFKEFSNGDIWLYGKANGCLRISRQGNSFKTHAYGRQELQGSSEVNFIYEDNSRHTWIGAGTTIFRVSSGNSLQPVYRGRESFIKAIADDKQLYFISRQQGILVYDIPGAQFRTIAIPGMQLTGGAFLSPSRLLLSTKESGIYIADMRNGHLQSLGNIPGRTDIMSDQQKNIWINNHTGNIWYFNTQQEQLKRLELIPAAVMQRIDDERYAFYSGKNENTWITTYGGGLYCYNRSSGALQHFSYRADNPSGLSTNYLLSVMEDRTGLVWVGAEHTGLHKLVPQSLAVTRIFPDENLNGRYTANSIKTIYEDSYHRLWVSTRNGRLHLYNSRLEKIRSLDHLLPGQSANIYCMREDANGYLWIGTKGEGLYIVHKDSLQQKARHFLLQETPVAEGKPGSNGNKQIYAILQDSRQRMWIGTFGGGLHLAGYHGGRSFSSRLFFKNDMVPVYVRCLLQDRQDRIWAGTNNGLLSFDPEKLLQNEQAYVSYQSDLKSREGLASNEIKTICEDHKGRIWIGTTGGGFSRFIPASGNHPASFHTYTTEQGLSHDIVNGMQEDNLGNLWLGTENGLTRFNPDNNTFEVFYFANNTLGNLFSESACLRRNDGQLLWGSLNGFYAFYPGQLKTQHTEAPVLLTGFNIAGNNIQISDQQEITLEPGQKIFSLTFATLAFKNPQKNKYTYILEHYEDEWNQPSGYNVATYRNLPPGEYVFRVKGTNDDGSWSKEEATIRIKVQPPFWRSNVAFMLYLVIITILVLSIRYVTRRIHRLQQAVEVEKQLTEYKLNFFTDISHEFRTPLSLILSAMESLLPNRQSLTQSNKHLLMMQKHVQHLMRLADQLLDFRKIQYNKMTLQVSPTEVVSFTESICNGFSELAVQKQICLSFNSNVPSYTVPVDTSKLDKMLYNLLSNALKFTPADGRVNVQVIVDEASQIWQVKVSDTGIAIPADRQHLVFQKFTQLNFSPTGTGIGLSLTKELVELHKGSISFHNNTDAGATFLLTLPLHETAYSADEIVSSPTENIISPVISYLTDTETDDIPTPSSTYNVLIIEDNAEIRGYLSSRLSKYFHVHTAANGREGLATAITLAPDLIVCDVMLPGLSGIEVTQRIRGEFQTCHIPIVLLTALSSGEHQLQGIDAGADAYIAKPFSTRFLLTNIIRIIEQREKIRKRFANDPGFFAVHISENEADQQFIERINLVIEKNLDNTQFSVDEFAAAMKLGRTLFYKKIKGLTGYSPNEYIRLVRVKKAAEFLNTGEYTVSEVAYKVGMNDPFYFSKCFKGQFGVPPSVHLKKVKAG